MWNFRTTMVSWIRTDAVKSTYVSSHGPFSCTSAYIITVTSRALLHSVVQSRRAKSDVLSSCMNT